LHQVAFVQLNRLLVQSVGTWSGANKMRLTNTNIRNVKPQEAVKKMSDGNGLQLWVFPDGAKRSRNCLCSVFSPVTFGEHATGAIIIANPQQ
jgi:hypothetical protein